MEVEIKIDPNCTKTKVTIVTHEVTDEINELVRKISESTPSVFVGFRDDNAFVLDLEKVIRFYTAEQKVYAVTGEEDYTVRLRLYELEERLPSKRFVRISNSEIINLKQIEGFDLSFTGTICVKFRDRSTSFVSRRYVPKVKKVFGL